MKSHIIIILLLSYSLKINAQFKLKNDALFKYSSDSLLLKAGIKKPDFNKINFELRFWRRDLSRTYAHELFIFQHDNKNIWHLLQYQICLENDHYEILNLTDSTLHDWHNKWTHLVKEKILSLPTENKIYRKWHSSKDKVIVTGDGVLYIFELSTKKAKRQYSYSNPETDLKNYDLGNEELIHVNNIIDELEIWFKFKEHLQICKPPG